MKVRIFAAVACAALGISMSIDAGYLSYAWAKKRAEVRPTGELEIGWPAPKADVKLTDVSDRVVSLREAKGKKGLLVIFSCNTCPFVLAWEDRYQTVAEQCRKNGVGMVLINSNEGQRLSSDSLLEMKAHAKEKGYTFSYLVDANAELADAFGATRTPHVFLFDAKLKLVYRGAIDDNSRNADDVKQHYLPDAIDALFAGKPVAMQITKSIGCGIKRKS